MAWGGKRIKDATALPSDVAKGKVFYNNDGRQEGTYIPSAITIKKMILPSPSGESKNMSLNDPYNYTFSGSGFGNFKKFWTWVHPDYCQVIEGIKRVIGVGVNSNDTYSYCPTIKGETTIWAYESEGYDKPWFFQKENKIYICKYVDGMPKDKQITIYYTE